MSKKPTYEELQQELDDWKESHRIVMEEKCPVDEKHCTCVPSLKKEIEKLKKEIDTLVKENSDLSWSVPLPPLRHEMGG